MSKHLPAALAFLILLVIAPNGLGQAGVPKGNPADMAALAKAAEAFVEAFHKGDAKALAAFWMPDGDYTNQTGQHLQGRAAIEKAFQGFFAEHKGAKLRIDSHALRFVTPELAIEDGTTAVLPADGTPPSRARYTIVHVKKNGQWALASVRDAPYAAPTNYEHLRPLEWMIGDWVDAEEKGEVARVSFAWSENQQFLVASLRTTSKNILLGEATQWIGWDPNSKQPRSWTFDSQGGFAEGSWAQDGKRWTIKTQTTLRDGKKLAATNIITRLDPNTISWQSKNRTLNGESLPDIPEVKMKRVR